MCRRALDVSSIESFIYFRGVVFSMAEVDLVDLVESSPVGVPDVSREEAVIGEENPTVPKWVGYKLRDGSYGVRVKHPVDVFRWSVVEKQKMTTDEILAWREKWCEYRNAYMHDDGPTHTPEEFRIAKNSETFSRSKIVRENARTPYRWQNPLQYTNSALWDCEMAYAKKENVSDLLRAFEYAGWDTKE